MVSALLPTPPAPTTTSLYSVMIHLQVKKKTKIQSHYMIIFSESQMESISLSGAQSMPRAFST